MKRIYILRHAKSSWANPGMSDIDRPLNPRGERQTLALAKWFSNNQNNPQIAYLSPSKRTMATFDTIKSGLPDCSAIVDDNLFHGSIDDYLSALWSTDEAHSSAMIVGHNPTCDEITRILAKPSSPAMPDLMSHHFGTANLAIFEVLDKGWTEIGTATCSLVTLLRPKDLDGYT